LRRYRGAVCRVAAENTWRLVHERRVGGIVDAIRLALLIMLGEVHDGKGKVRMSDRTVQAVDRLYHWRTRWRENEGLPRRTGRFPKGVSVTCFWRSLYWRGDKLVAETRQKMLSLEVAKSPAPGTAPCDHIYEVVEGFSSSQRYCNCRCL